MRRFGDATHTVAGLEVSKRTYDEIAKLLREAQYDHVFMEDGMIDMSGIGLTKPAQTDVGARMQKAREAVGLTIAQVARKTLIAQDTIHAYEQGSMAPYARNMRILANLYNTTPGYLASGKD